MEVINYWLAIPVLAGHLWCVNVAAAGPLVYFWLEYREARGDKSAGHCGRALASWAVTLYMAGMVLGMAVGLLAWSDEYEQLLLRFRGRLTWGAAELVFSLALMAGHLVWWQRRPDVRPVLRVVRMALPLLAGTNLLYHFPFLFIAISHVAATQGYENGIVSGQEFRQLIQTPAIYTRALHFVLAAFAVTGITLMQIGLGQKESYRVIGWGAWLALIPTVLQIVVGLWVWATLPVLAARQLMGDDVVATTFFVLSLLLTLYLLHQLVAAVLADRNTPAVWRCTLAMAAIVFLMTATLQRIEPVGVA